MPAKQPPIERAFFREDGDGVTLFFPWGLAHRGYRLTSEAAKKRAARGASFLVSATIAIGTWTAYALQPLLESEATEISEILAILGPPGAALALVIAGYGLWVSRFVERFSESDLRISRDERLREAAALVPPWKIAMIGVVVCGLSVLAIWLQPRAWWLGALGLALGVGALVWSRLLKRAADSSR